MEHTAYNQDKETISKAYHKVLIDLTLKGPLRPYKE